MCTSYSTSFGKYDRIAKAKRSGREKLKCFKTKQFLKELNFGGMRGPRCSVVILTSPGLLLLLPPPRSHCGIDSWDVIIHMRNHGDTICVQLTHYI